MCSFFLWICEYLLFLSSFLFLTLIFSKWDTKVRHRQSKVTEIQQTFYKTKLNMYDTWKQGQINNKLVHYANITCYFKHNLLTASAGFICRGSNAEFTAEERNALSLRQKLTFLRTGGGADFIINALLF